MLTHEIPPAFLDGVPMYQPPPGQSRVYQVTQLRTYGVDRQESASSLQGSSSRG